jgi:hypothetical protein
MTLENFAVGTFIAACLSSVLAGVVLLVVTDNSWWLWLCVPVVLFLS